MSAKKEQITDFEGALKRLEEIVRLLESGDAALEQSIALYEEGMKLKALCEKKLEDARMKVEKITLNVEGKPKTQPFEGV